jgi:hypothetical protein
MKHIKSCLKIWNKEVFGNIQEEKGKLKEEMEKL